jgi:hypothetical protein
MRSSSGEDEVVLAEDAATSLEDEVVVLGG